MLIDIFLILIDVFAHLIFVITMFGIGIYASLKCDFKSIEKEFDVDEERY